MIQRISRDNLLSHLSTAQEESLDFIVLATGTSNTTEWFPVVDLAAPALKKGGLMFVQGVPEKIPDLGVYTSNHLRFRYWIAVESALRGINQKASSPLPSVHAAILMFVKGDRFTISRVRFPHQCCLACKRTLRDWGGKRHLMHPEGTAISDVWKNLPPEDNYTGISAPVLQVLLQMVSPTGRPEDAEKLEGIIASAEQESRTEIEAITAQPSASVRPPLGSLGARKERRSKRLPINEVIQGDAIEVLSTLPDESVDLVFVDPPYNLGKGYTAYDDQKNPRAYLEWCNAWLSQCVRVLKPSGSLYVLNLPRWGMYHATYLNRFLHFQNWIVWDALSEPRGKMMPAHYALLFYTKHPTNFTFHYEDVKEIDARFYCLRPSCVGKRKAKGDDQKELLTDIWWDIHRLRHRRYRDPHPCPLPPSLIERIIRISTNLGDVVLDAMAGTGTTAVVAAQLGRKYIAIDIDPAYAAIARRKLAEEVEGKST